MSRKPKKADGIAATADRHLYYQLAVQCVEAEIDMVDKTYKELRGRRATTLREDFCGTANTSCEWVRRRKNNTAIGCDWDAEVLEWGRRNNLAKLTAEQKKRITLIQQDVRTAHPTLVDIVIAMNFSYLAFKTRDELRGYFAAAHAALADDGVLMLDLYGGHESWCTTKEKTKHKAKHKFTYYWHQKKFNPITFEALCYIHFKFADGSKMKRAFAYDWRMWTPPEVRELLAEAGFRTASVYWEGTDEDGEGNDTYTPAEVGDDDPSWIAYIVAEK